MVYSGPRVLSEHFACNISSPPQPNEGDTLPHISHFKDEATEALSGESMPRVSSLDSEGARLKQRGGGCRASAHGEPLALARS